jgi:putative SOS response-associated peptidase YedK
MNNNIFLFAGIYNEYAGENGCAIITKKANKSLGKVHHRMPILLEKNEARNWLQGEDVYASNLSEKIEYYPVSMFVNSPRNNTEDCVRNTGSTGEHY